MQGSWLDRRFGSEAPKLRQGLTLGLSVANNEAANEYAASTFRKRAVYGTARYYYGLDAVAYSLKKIATAELFRSYGRPFALIDGIMIYPWCFANSRDVDHHEIPMKVVSNLRRDLFAARTASEDRAQGWIDFDAIDKDPEGVFRHFTAEEAQAPREFKALIAGYASNPESGLLRVIVGDIELYSSGHLHWNLEEELQIEDALAGDLGVTKEDIKENLQRFDSRPEPDVALGLNDEDQAGNAIIEDSGNGIEEDSDGEEGNESSNAS